MRGERTGEVYEQVYRLVARIPRGRVASYGQIAAMVDGCTARMVGYAMSAFPGRLHIPWQRVVNSKGEISARAGGGMAEQRRLLEKEGVHFRESGRIDMKRHRWEGPGEVWFVESGLAPVGGGKKGRPPARSTGSPSRKPKGR